MTVEQRLRKHLTDNGLLEPEITDIIQKVKADETLRLVRFRDPEEGYPRPLLGALVATTTQVAVAHLKEHMPQHFAIFMLTDTIPGAPTAETA